MKVNTSVRVDKFLQRLEKSGDKKAVRLITGKIAALGDNQNPPGAAKVRGYGEGVMRLRVGDYRIVYVVGKDVVEIIAAGHRKDVYRNLGGKD